MARSGTKHVTSTGGRRDIVDDPLVRDGSPGVFTGIRGFGWRRRDHPGYIDHPTYASSS